MTVAPELLYLLAGDPEEFAEVVGGMQPADIAEALRSLAPEAAARVLAALPFETAVLVLDDPDLDNRLQIIRSLDAHTCGPLLSAMSGDQQAELFREMPEEERERLLPTLHPKAQEALRLLLKYPAESAGGIMTTEFLSVPTTWTWTRRCTSSAASAARKRRCTRCTSWTR
jgi:Mg/Co/Ni transporter MgtE (contains CBS domain)